MVQVVHHLVFFYSCLLLGWWEGCSMNFVPFFSRQLHMLWVCETLFFKVLIFIMSFSHLLLTLYQSATQTDGQMDGYNRQTFLQNGSYVAFASTK